MPAYCSVSACKITTDHVKTLGIQVSFFSFPRDEETCKQWILKCNRKAAINVKNARVCSLHFAPEDFERDLKSELLNLPRKLKIKRGSVPSLKLDLSSVEKCCNSKIDAVSIKDECKVQTRKRKKLFKSIEDNPKENLAKEQNCQNGQLKKAKLPKVETKKLVTLASKPVIEIVKKSKKITPNLLRSKPNILKTGIKHRNKKEQKNVNSVGNETKSNRAILPSQSNNLIVPLNPAPNLALPRLAPLSSTTVLPVKLSFVQLSSNSDMNELQKLRSTNNHLTYVNEMLRKQLAHIKVELEKSKNEIRSLQVERRRQTNFTRESTKKSPIYTEILNLLRKSFTPAQIKVLLNQKSRIHWKEDDLIRAFTLFYLSKKSYIYLRKHLNYPLPGKNRERHCCALR